MEEQILITGGAGFIGSHLAQYYVEHTESSVTVLDNYFTGTPNNHVDGVKYLTGSTANITELIKHPVDLIFHLGEYSRVEQSFADLQTCWESNVIGTKAVLDFARDTGAKLVYAGSSTKFGDGGHTRQSSPYAWTKAVNTELVMNYAAWFDLPFAITYFYNAYGGREISDGKYATLIGLFRQKMRRGEPLTVVAPGTQERNFTHIEDIVDALVKIGRDGYGDEFGIGAPEAYSVMEVAEMFGGEISLLPERRGNRMTAEVLDAKTRELGWIPRHRLPDYINRCRENDW